MKRTEQNLRVVTRAAKEPDDLIVTAERNVCAKKIDPLGQPGFLLHEDASAYTNEGLGSHARGTVFPLVQIALETGLIPLFFNTGVACNVRRDYTQVDMANFLEFDQRYTISDLYSSCHLVEVNTWMDRRLGSACGDATILGEMLSKVLVDMKDVKEPLLVTMHGPLHYIDPVPPVHKWLQERSIGWKENAGTDCCLRVAVHIRVPEDFCDQAWKDANSADKFMSALAVLQNIDHHALNDAVLDVFTEEQFPEQAEHAFLKQFPNAVVHRGTSTTALSDLRSMACADILVVSASHFSALAGYLCIPSCLILLANAEDNTYFRQHIKLGCKVLTVEHPNLSSLVREKISFCAQAGNSLGEETKEIDGL